MEWSTAIVEGKQSFEVNKFILVDLEQTANPSQVFTVYFKGKE